MSAIPTETSLAVFLGHYPKANGGGGRKPKGHHVPNICGCESCRYKFLSKLSRAARLKAATPKEIREWKDTAQLDYEDEWGFFVRDLADVMASAVYDAVDKVMGDLAADAEGGPVSHDAISAALLNNDHLPSMLVSRKGSKITVKLGKARAFRAPAYPDWKNADWHPTTRRSAPQARRPRRISRPMLNLGRGRCDAQKGGPVVQKGGLTCTTRTPTVASA